VYPLPVANRHPLHVDGSPEAGGVYAGQLDTSETRRLFAADGPAEFAPSGHLLFVRQGTLFAQTFDPVRLELSGNPFPIAKDVAPDSLSVSEAGPVTYRAAIAGKKQQLVWFDRNGKELGKLADPIDGEGDSPNISPDGRRIALQRAVNGNVRRSTLPGQYGHQSGHSTHHDHLELEGQTLICPIFLDELRRTVPRAS
jgi:hypothetical protein